MPQGAGGYSASGSNANATPQAISAGTVFNFNSAGTSFEGGSQSQTANPTAVASAGGGTSAVPYANPNASNPVVSGLGFITSNPVATAGVVVVLAVAAGLLIYFNTRTP